MVGASFLNSPTACNEVISMKSNGDVVQLVVADGDKEVVGNGLDVLTHDQLAQQRICEIIE